MSMKITDWAVEDRPRERLWNKGPSSLSDAELLAILIGSGTRDRSALDLARELLALAGNSLSDQGKLSAGEIRKI
jgi:DNA repair protein RadC